MSATGRTPGLRSDCYPTPSWCVRSLLEALPLPSGRWLEPCAGDGAIVRAVDTESWIPSWTVIEPRGEVIDALRASVDRPGRSHHLFQTDALDRMAKFDQAGIWHEVAITNPPYSLAMQMIERMVRIAEHTVVLLRLNFVGSAVRAQFMRENPPDIYVLPNRPKFGYDKYGRPGSDSIEYAWFHWYRPAMDARRAFGRIRVLRPLDRSERPFEAP